MHSHAKISFFQRQCVINTVTDHAREQGLAFVVRNQPLLLLWMHPSKYDVFVSRLDKIFVTQRSQHRTSDGFVRIIDASCRGDELHRPWVVARYYPDANALVLQKLYSFLDTITQRITQNHRTNSTARPSRQIFQSAPRIIKFSQQQHTQTLISPFVDLALTHCIDWRQLCDKLWCAHDNRASSTLKLKPQTRHFARRRERHNVNNLGVLERRRCLQDSLTSDIATTGLLSDQGNNFRKRFI